MANDQPAAVASRQGTPAGRKCIGYRCFAGMLLAVGLALASLASLSPAQTSMQLIRWREFSCAKQTSQLGGQAATLSSVQRTGFLVLGDGQFARSSGWFVHTEDPDGNEYYQGFVMYDFEDGSSILAKIDASGPPRLVPNASSISVQQTGTITFLSGTKRFKGITGRGTVTSRMPSKWDVYAEIDGVYNLPE